ncbi:MAG TPA: 6-carboxytetrahydropterin synthase [Ignavibacteriaceae bacterium]|jgi:6-pyruvoyltetrahydropterin/6-carboxytetrahydropterin synthase|nr:6-carboxytetrahydropterin synthase [Ignavibacteriaceae bacterium]
MKIAKEFNWEMGHRLPEHFGKCKNIHGHSYKMLVEIEGDVMENGMVMDYYHLKDAIEPLVDKLDHAFLAYEEDKDVIDFLIKMNSKKMIVNFQSTVENITRFFLEEIKKSKMPQNIHKIKVRVCETPDDYAEEEISI